VTDTLDIAQTKAELDSLCDSYAEQIAKVQQTFAEITLKIIALPQKHGFEGMKLGLELMPRLHQIQRDAAAVINAASGKPAN
jgi:hypothetical protein